MAGWDLCFLTMVIGNISKTKTPVASGRRRRCLWLVDRGRSVGLIRVYHVVPTGTVSVDDTGKIGGENRVAAGLGNEGFAVEAGEDVGGEGFRADVD